MLLVDVLTGPDQLRYVPLPAAAMLSRRLYIDEGGTDPARRVRITDAGAINLVCVTDNTPCSCGCPCCSSPRSPFTITTWTLVNVDLVRWEKDSAMTEAKEFFLALDTDRRLPRLKPQFPTVRMDDPDVVCFVLEEQHRIFWLVKVDMRTKALQSAALYILGGEGSTDHSSEFRPKIGGIGFTSGGW